MKWVDLQLRPFRYMFATYALVILLRTYSNLPAELNGMLDRLACSGIFRRGFSILPAAAVNRPLLFSLPWVFRNTFISLLSSQKLFRIRALIILVIG